LTEKQIAELENLPVLIPFNDSQPIGEGFNIEMLKFGILIEYLKED
jgi:hypothetical protein